MLIIEYDSVIGEIVPDGHVRDWAESIAESYAMCKEPKDLLHTTVSSVLMVDAIRLLIMKGEINHKEVVFRFEGHDLEVDKNGMLRVWPKGFCDIYDNILEELLGLGK